MAPMPLTTHVVLAERSCSSTACAPLDGASGGMMLKGNRPVPMAHRKLVPIPEIPVSSKSMWAAR
jgi:hypothetical protein